MDQIRTIHRNHRISTDYFQSYTQNHITIHEQLMYVSTIWKCKRFYPLFNSLTNFSLLYYTAIRVNPSWTSRNVSPVAIIIERGCVPNFKSSCH